MLPNGTTTVRPTAKALRVARFLAWFLWPGALMVASYVALLLMVTNWYVPGHPDGLLSLGILGMFAVMTVFGVWMIVHLFIALGMLRRRLGWYTKAEKNKAAVADAYRRGIEWAIVLRDRLADGAPPVQLQTWDVMLEPDEVLLMDAPMQYGRWYGTDAVYTHRSTVAFGRPSFVIGSMVGSAIGNAVSRSSAQAAAQPMWRENQAVRTLVTDRRIMCRTTGGWLSFWYRGVIASHPDPAGSTLILEFHDTEPLRLHGYDGAGLCVFATATLHGRSTLRHHPGLTSLPAAV